MKYPVSWDGRAAASRPVGTIARTCLRMSPPRDLPAVRPKIYLPTGPARYSGLEVDTPFLFLFYHVEKTAGSAVMKWLHKLVSTHDRNLGNLTPRLTSLYDFTHTSCLLSQHGDLFPGYAKLWDERRCSVPHPPPWQRSATAAEFHAYTKKRYWEDFVPVLPQLRAKYAAVNGTVITVTLLREPISHIMSAYKMWPPSQRCKAGGSCDASFCSAVDAARPKRGARCSAVQPCSPADCPTAGKHALPLPWWLPRAIGLQAGSLTLDSWPNKHIGFHNLRGCQVTAADCP